MTTFDSYTEYTNKIIEYQMNGNLLVKGDEREWEFTKQAKLKFYLEPSTLKENALNDQWYVFVNEIHTHTGTHVHQGGIFIFVLEGRGYTMVDGERWDWESGDLILLPLKPGGVEHQHFNLEQDKPCKWLAISYLPFRLCANSIAIQQKSLSPLYKSEE
jgi:gentisate 1,2-dioxygenase